MSRLMQLPRRAGMILGMIGIGLLLGSGAAGAQTHDDGTATGTGASDSASARTGANASAGNSANASISDSTGAGTGANPSSSDNADATTAVNASSSASTSTGTSTSTVDGPSPDTSQDSWPPPKQHSQLLLDIEDYYTAPLHWDARDWAYFGGAAALFAAARHYDTQVRTHFIKEGAPVTGSDTDDLHDALPAVAALAGTWLYANLIDSSDGRHEAWDMVEAGGLSVTTSFVLSLVAGRERPDQTADPSKWFAGGSSFPSLHTTAAFAIGTVLAESGNDDYRWIRRLLGYGAVAGYTAYERLKHNDHWLSDDVAGAEIGGASAHFVLERDQEREEAKKNYSWSLVPEAGGAMLTATLTLE
jgi:membrane-associated phospholipid phosphatase